MHVFTYGTLMFPQVWQAVAGRAHPSVEGDAGGYAIYRVRDAVFPGIVAQQDQIVRGVVYLDVEAESLERLDRFEDDFYRRTTISIQCDDGVRRDADAYVVPDERRSILTDEVWRREQFVASGGLEEFIRRFQGFERIASGE